MKCEKIGPYVVWVHRERDIWNSHSVATFEKALAMRDELMVAGNANVVITKLVEFVTTEVTE